MIELMVVIGILGIVMTMGVPFIRGALESRGINGATKQVQEICANARAQAILSGGESTLRIRPKDRMFSIGGAAPRPQPRLDSPDVAGNDWRMADRGAARSSRASSGTGSGSSVTLDESIMVEGLGIDGWDYTEDDEAVVSFFPNGTCGEMSIVLLNDRNERRNIWLEVVTGYAEVETDPQKFRAR